MTAFSWVSYYYELDVLHNFQKKQTSHEVKLKLSTLLQNAFISVIQPMSKAQL